jgi:LysM repeat protein
MVLRITAILLVLGAAGCASAEHAAPPVAPVADAQASDTVPRPAESFVEAPSLEERWAAPFGVESSGLTAPREVRTAVARPPSRPAPVRSGQRTPEREEPDVAPSVEEPPPASDPRPDTPVRPAPARPRPQPATHRVVPGETFFGIARRYEVTAAELAAANPGVTPERLRAGEVLRIPTARGAADFQPGSRLHRVSSGETLFGIARRYGVPSARIRQVNRLEDDRLRVGQTLVIPPAD